MFNVDLKRLGQKSELQVGGHAIATFSPCTWPVELALADKMEELRETLQEAISKIDRISDSSPSSSSPPAKHLTRDPCIYNHKLTISFPLLPHFCTRFSHVNIFMTLRLVMAYSVFVMNINRVLEKYLLFPDEATVLAKPVGNIYKF